MPCAECGNFKISARFCDDCADALYRRASESLVETTVDDPQSDSFTRRWSGDFAGARLIVSRASGSPAYSSEVILPDGSRVKSPFEFAFISAAVRHVALLARSAEIEEFEIRESLRRNRERS